MKDKADRQTDRQSQIQEYEKLSVKENIMKMSRIINVNGKHASYNICKCFNFKALNI